MSKIAIIDYGMGNVRSVLNAVDYCGFETQLTSDAGEIRDAERIILPGDGAFGDAMGNLQAAGLVEILEREVLEKGKPFLGICVGMQILATSSPEHGEGTQHKGLGWIDADIVPIARTDPALKVPHMGWSAVEKMREHEVLSGIKTNGQSFYFVHSYWMQIRNPENLLLAVEHGQTLTAMVGRDNIVATQFHPEKSQDNGLELLTNFLNWRV